MGLFGGIYDMVAGDPNEAAEKQFNQLGTQQIGQGQQLVTPAASYYESILSGDPSRIATTLAPAISAQQGQLDQSRMTGAEFGTRSGGTAAANTAAEAGARRNILDLIGSLQQGAAGAAGNLGTNLESLGSGNVERNAQLRQQRRNSVMSDIGGIEQTAAQIAGGFAGVPGAGASTPATSVPAAGASTPATSVPAAHSYTPYFTDLSSSVVPDSGYIPISQSGLQPWEY